MDEFSHQGYVAWFGLIEIICKENGRELTGKLDISPIYLKRKLRISSTKLKQIFGFCSTNGKLFFDFSQEKWSFDFPKVAEIRDNYTKDLQAVSKKPSKQKEKEKEKERIKPKDVFSFEDIWKRYPNKDGRKSALSHFNKTIQTGEDYTSINKALDNYLQSDKVQKGFIKNGSTWFNNWQDWVDWEETGNREVYCTLPALDGKGIAELYSKEDAEEHKNLLAKAANERSGPGG